MPAKEVSSHERICFGSLESYNPSRSVVVGGGGEHATIANRAAIVGAIVGNFVDQFDIFLPVIALAPASATVFGPTDIARNAGVIFVATLLGRPVGAAIFGPLSDRIGRARTTILALMGIAVTTLLIALVPGYTVIGSGALIAVVALRFLGGIFLGGEYTSALPLAMEGTAPGLVDSLTCPMVWLPAMV